MLHPQQELLAELLSRLHPSLLPLELAVREMTWDYFEDLASEVKDTESKVPFLWFL